MPRTILVADPDAAGRERITEIAKLAGYRVLNAKTPWEAAGALDACPISAVIIAEELLGGSDLHRLLLRAPVLVLCESDQTVVPQDMLPRTVTPSALIDSLIAVAGDARFRGSRYFVPYPPIHTRPD
jgi:DNA-binding response OmpR family regulator